MNRYWLWIDGVGSFLVCTGDGITLGQPIPGQQVDVPILADISRRHAVLRRSGEHYQLDALRETRLDGRPVVESAMLGRDHLLELGASVRLRFKQSHPWSSTARLDFASRHRTQPSADGILLVADTCVLGPNLQSHVVCRDWAEQVVLVRHGEQWSCRLDTAGMIVVNGEQHASRAPLPSGSTVVGRDFSFRWEAWND